MADQTEIRGRLPHRFPMLLVDRVLSVEPERSLVAHKAVSCNEPWYGAGSSGRAADPAADATAFGYPGTLLVESWCQSAGVLATWESPNPDVLEGDVMLFGGMSGVEFHHPVLPGQVLEHRVRQERRVGETVMFEGESLVGGRTVMSVGRITMAFRPARVLRPETS
ncbi:beta-hydroxyacyl-ACP dehydratase [Streptomyces durbertensis]|uniref:Beta-hydroxyacyl-ACP dehydratase n=1 Tax=Streptomyces durbertensis TaxID=2448886 RepID=A0ABR6EMY9_9ACTN|nr:beta-hydroxyacyl-ACP dehydratase [Streptomyces durbertensis]